MNEWQPITKNRLANNLMSFAENHIGDKIPIAKLTNCLFLYEVAKT